MEDESMTKQEKRELARESKIEERKKEEKMGTFKKVLVWLVILGLGLFLGSKVVNWLRTPSETNTNIEINDSDWVKGDLSAKVSLVEYGDFQCPACASYALIVNKLSQDFPDDLKIAYRHFPLPQHKNAIPAAKASEAAGRQGKFWEMLDKLYEKQEEWVNESNPFNKFLEYAKEIDLDEEKFKNDYGLDEIEKKIDEQYSSTIRLRLNSTPTFYLNGEKLSDPPSNYEDFRLLIESAVNK